MGGIEGHVEHVARSMDVTGGMRGSAMGMSDMNDAISIKDGLRMGAALCRDGAHTAILSSNSCAAHRRTLAVFRRMLARAIESMQYEVVYLRSYVEEGYTSDIFEFAEAFADVMALPGDEIMDTVTAALTCGIEAHEVYHEITGHIAERGCFSDYTWAI